MAVSWPRSDVPTVQLSRVCGLDPPLHIAIGRALAPLRDEAVLIPGNVLSFPDLPALFAHTGAAAGDAFDGWLQQAVAAPAADRDTALRHWVEAPSARAAHPREEHLLPLMVVAGAAGEDRGRVPFSAPVMGVRASAVHFG